MSSANERKRDESLRWAVCDTCGRKHMPGSPCPPRGRWLVLALCPTCRADTGRYCRRHQGRAR